MINKDYFSDAEQLSNQFFSAAFPDADSPAELYRQVYKYTDCGAYLFIPWAPRRARLPRYDAADGESLIRAEDRMERREKGWK